MLHEQHQPVHANSPEPKRSHRFRATVKGHIGWFLIVATLLFCRYC